VLVASGIRMDLARRSPEYMRNWCSITWAGMLKVAPEHTDPTCWTDAQAGQRRLRKFTEVFHRESQKAGKKQYIVPYFIASHPGSDLDAMIDLACF
jgi:radical SAM superfamily enzyme YgiQ (UPF0313 family)